MGWLSGWNNRIKLTIDYTKIDTDLTYFPVTVFLTPTHGDCVFDELTTDANRLKIAFTSDDGETQLYGEIEKWDDANKLAIIHVSKTDWAIASDADTLFYMYYDVDHADNTDYIGDINSVAAQSVWDGNFKAVYHMADGADTSHLYDSTSNNHDATKKGAGEPAEAAGKVGQAQDFDGADDYIDLGNANDDFDIGTSDYTLEAIIKNSDKTDFKRILVTEDGSIWSPLYTASTTGLMRMGINGSYMSPSGGSDICDGNWNYVGVTADRSANATFYKNESSDGTADISAHVSYDIDITNLYIGRDYVRASRFWKDYIDEVRISITLRSAAWLKATYNSLWDTLLTYGSEEIAEVVEGVTQYLISTLSISANESALSIRYSESELSIYGNESILSITQ